jgi:hypothetical protein
MFIGDMVCNLIKQAFQDVPFLPICLPARLLLPFCPLCSSPCTLPYRPLPSASRPSALLRFMPFTPCQPSTIPSLSILSNFHPYCPAGLPSFCLSVHQPPSFPFSAPIDVPVFCRTYSEPLPFMMTCLPALLLWPFCP